MFLFCHFGFHTVENLGTPYEAIFPEGQILRHALDATIDIGNIEYLASSRVAASHTTRVLRMWNAASRCGSSPWVQ